MPRPAAKKTFLTDANRASTKVLPQFSHGAHVWFHQQPSAVSFTSTATDRNSSGAGLEPDAAWN
jgi:hypothetical protein